MTLTRQQQAGQAMVETVVVIVMTILLIFGAIQFAFIYTAKSTLNYATFEATRAGALNYADRRAIEFALAAGLAPLKTSIDESTKTGVIASVKNKVAQANAVKQARNEYLGEIDDGEFICIERINPTVGAFSDYAVKDPTGNFAGEKLIPNDHLRFRSAKVKGTSGVSLQDANLLKLRVTYCHPMIVPVISVTIQQLMGVRADPDPVTGRTIPTLGNFHENCFANGRMPIVSQAIVRMQTPVRNDTFSASCD